MKKVNFIPKTDIDEYLNNDFNIEIFNDLTESKDWKGIFEPLEFLNLLYEQLEIVKANKEKPSAVVKHLLGLELDKTKLCYLLNYLSFCTIVGASILSRNGVERTDEERSLHICHNFIEKERTKLEAELYPKTEPEPQPEKENIRYTAKHYVLAYLIECNAKGKGFPIGQKKELEKIGNEKMGAGKGNRFYKVFNEVINKDLNAEKNLFEIGGEYWRKAVIELSNAPELVENYLQSKQL